VIDDIIGFRLQLELNQLGIKVNTTLIELIKSLSGKQVKNALLVVKETLSTGKKIRSKAELLRKVLEMNCPVNVSE
jgi:hypothetical protein